MRGKLIVFMLGLMALCTYVASPFVAAWSIREAIRNGDTAYLETRVDWPQVKRTLTASMSDYALGAQPPPATTTTANAAARPGLWQRFKNAAGRRVVASAVDNMVTPAGLSRLFSYRTTFNEKVRGIPDERKTLSLQERVARTWKRVTRAEFLSPTRFVLDMRDKTVEQRRYAGILELQAGTWRLVHLEMKRDDTTPAAVATSATGTSGLWSSMKQAALP